MDNRVLVSVIVPCYNCAETLDRCVESIRNQTYSNIEIILVDDGSMDETPSKCDEFAIDDKRISTIHQQNGGLVRAWKAGVSASQGDYIAFCDSDDYVDNDVIEKTIRAALESGADIVTFGIRIEYNDGSELLLANNLDIGLYTGEDYKELKESFLFSGKMQSQKILNSRVAKLFKKEILCNCMKDICDELTNGEDAVTTYTTIVNSKTLFNISDYYPYHYLRNNQSMVGKHDEKWFSKMALLREELVKNSIKYHRQDLFQIDNFFFSYVVMYAKKEIIRSEENSKKIINNLLKVRKSRVVEESLKNIDVSEYSITSKLFAILFIKKRMILLYYLTKGAGFIGCGKQ